MKFQNGVEVILGQRIRIIKDGLSLTPRFPWWDDGYVPDEHIPILLTWAQTYKEDEIVLLDYEDTKKNLVNLYGLKNFDYAIPLSWANDFRDKMGIQPDGYVWSYARNKFGEPFPLSKTWATVLEAYRRI